MIVNKEGTRSDLDDLFDISGIFDDEVQKHTAFIVIQDDEISICRNAKDLVEKYPWSAEVLVCWPGKWRSDYFYFKISDYAEWKAKKKDE